VHCSCFRDVVIDQIISLHCIEVSSYDCCHQMSDFKAKMHQFDFGYGSVPDALAGFKGPTSKGREGMGGRREGRGRGDLLQGLRGDRRPCVRPHRMHRVQICGLCYTDVPWPVCLFLCDNQP